MSFQMRLDARSRKSARFIARVHKQMQEAFARHYKTTGITQQNLADKLGVHRSFVNRKLSGEGNLTLRTIADFAWALDCDVDFELVPTRSASHNYKPSYAEPSSISSGGNTHSVSIRAIAIDKQPSNASIKKLPSDA